MPTLDRKRNLDLKPFSREQFQSGFLPARSIIRFCKHSFHFDVHKLTFRSPHKHLPTLTMRIFLSTLAAIFAISVPPSTAANTMQESSHHSYKHLAGLVHKVKYLTIDTNGRRLEGDDFQLYCDFLESTGESNCKCDETRHVATCVSNELCEDGICATVSLAVDLADDLSTIELIEICIDYKNGPPELKDGCGSFTVDIYEEFTSCEFSFENDAGVLTKCNSCTLCNDNGQQGINLDCANIEPEATTNECEDTSVEADETTDAMGDLSFFPGFNGNAQKIVPESTAAAGPVGAVVAILTAAIIAGLGA